MVWYYLTTLTSGVETKLPADYSGILAVPAVVADGPPAPVQAHLHSSLVLIGASTEADCPSGAVRSDSCMGQSETSVEN